MPGDTADDFRVFKEFRKQQRRLFGVECPGCPKVQPKRDPTILLPGQRCRVCGYRDTRTTEEADGHAQES